MKTSFKDIFQTNIMLINWPVVYINTQAFAAAKTFLSIFLILQGFHCFQHKMRHLLGCQVLPNILLVLFLRKISIIQVQTAWKILH